MVSTNDWNERIEWALVESQRTRFATIDGSEIFDVDGVVLTMSNLPDPSINGAILAREPKDPAAALERASALVTDRGFVFGILLRDGSHPSVDAAIRERGMRWLFSEPAMAVSLDALVIPKTPDGVVLRDADASARSDIARIDSDAFGTKLDVSQGMVNTRLFETPGFRVAQAFVEDRPVGQAMAHLVDRTVGVFGVAVDERHRGRGIGAAVTAEAVRGFDADFAWLFAREGANRVYARIGFTPLATWSVWIDP